MNQIKNPIHIPLDFGELVSYAASTYADQIAFMEGNHFQISYIDFQKKIRMMLAYFRQNHITHKKIALLGENSYSWIMMYFSGIIAQNIIVPIDKELPDQDIINLLKRCEAEYLICSDSYWDIAELSEIRNSGLQLLRLSHPEQYLESGKTAAADCPQLLQFPEADLDTVCTIVFTSGTTGVSKGVMLSQRNLLADVSGACQTVVAPTPTVLTLPLNHTFAITASLLSTFNNGICVAISKSLRKFRADLKKYKPKTLFLVPLYVEEMYKQIWKSAREQHKDTTLSMALRGSRLLRLLGVDLRQKLFSSIREEFGGDLELIVSGGAYLDEKYIRFFEDIGIEILNGYGITECGPIVAVTPNNAHRKASVGQLLPCNQVRIVNDEICVKGDNVMLGYYRDPRATTESFVDGWFRTGDLGCLDGTYLYITGRKKNLIILSNGKNVSPEELEQKLNLIPGVNEVIVSLQNRQITATIFGEDPERIKAEIHKLNKSLPIYEQIEKVVFQDHEFEKTTTQKIKRIGVNSYV